MYPWDEDRRRAAAADMQDRINREIADKAKLTSDPGDNRRLIVFVLAIILFKPFAEYCIDLYNTLAGYAQSAGALFGL